MKTYKKPGIELSSFDTDIIATSDGLKLTTNEDGAYVATQGAKITFAENNTVSIDPFKN